MATPEVAIRVGDEPVEAGGTVRGVAVVQRGDSCRALRIELLFVESSRGLLEVARIGDIVRHEPPSESLTAGEEIEFSLQMPADAEPPFDSVKGGLHWMVRVTWDQRGPDHLFWERVPVAA